MKAPPVNLFETVVDRATRYGATFELRDHLWVASARRKGSKIPMVEFHETTEDAAAKAFLAYFHKE